jgi:hypothetical protein
VSVDIETGSVATAVAVAQAGAAGINIEDAMGPAAAHADLVRSVKREAPQLFVNARTDTYWQRTGDLAQTVARVRRYAEAGADGVFVPGLAEPGDIEAVVAAVDLPVNVLFLPGRHTVTGLSDLGVRRISMGSLLFRAALAAVVDTARAGRDDLALLRLLLGGVRDDQTEGGGGLGFERLDEDAVLERLDRARHVRPLSRVSVRIVPRCLCCVVWPGRRRGCRPVRRHRPWSALAHSCSEC